MKKKLVSVLLVSAMVASMVAGCGDNGSSEDTKSGTESSKSESDDGHSLTIWAWDASFNIPAIKAAAEDYKQNVDPEFELNIEEQSQSSDIENAITLAGQSGDYDTLPDITLFQDHYFKQYHTNYQDAWMDGCK